MRIYECHKDHLEEGFSKDLHNYKVFSEKQVKTSTSIFSISRQQNYLKTVSARSKNLKYGIADRINT